MRPAREPGRGTLAASVIILASRPGSLRRCLASIAAARPPAPEEVLLVLNGLDDECAAAASEHARALPGLRVLRGEARSLGGARNMAIREARGDWLCFLDDDVVLPPSYFAALDGALRRHPDASAVGGPNITPPASPLFERCVGHLLGSWLAAGPFSRRVSGFPGDAWADDRALILCNLALRRSALRSEGLLFDEELARNEENLLLRRLLDAGHRALHAPDLFVFHERRRTFRGFCRQCFLSGEGRAAMTWKLPSSLRSFHLLALLPALCAAGAALRPEAFLVPAVAYAALAAGHALFLARRHAEGPASLGWLWVLLPAAHLSYAAGLLAGAWTGRPRRS
ncbi:MAG: glycosyltransferase [Elusimicrobia bacterium]|nr:glycosyltransferase [Elusimicrobiota bacterium]